VGGGWWGLRIEECQLGARQQSPSSLREPFEARFVN